MAIVLSAFWERTSSGGNLHYMIIDDIFGGVLSLPATIKIPVPAANQAVGGIFSAAKKYNVTELEYKIVQHGTPATNIRSRYRQPHALSVAVLNAVTGSAGKLGFKCRPQFKKKLSGPSLTKFKNAMRNLGLVSTGKGTAWQIHLWTIALHASNKNHEKVLRSHWSKLIKVSVRTKAGKTQFQAWYGSL